MSRDLFKTVLFASKVPVGKYMVRTKFWQGLHPRGDYIYIYIYIFPYIQTNSRRADYWEIVLLQLKQHMESVAQDIFKTVLFASKGPPEQNIWLV